VGWVKSAVTALASLAALAVLCFGVQALVLKRPGAAEIELVHTLSVLRTHSVAGTALSPSESAAGSICTTAERSDEGCPGAIVRWFGRELARGAPIVRLPVDVGGLRLFALRVRASRPPLELVVGASGAPRGLALGPRDHAGVLR
jgi:hypothetical protein